MLRTGICGKPGPMNSSTTRAALRRQLRRQRLAIAPSLRRQRARQLGARLQRLRVLRQARHVAAYQALGSAISLQAWIEAQPSCRRLYLPRVQRQRLQFLPLGPLSRRNALGIAEPSRGRARPIWALSAVLLPLLGFDMQGNRLGQGGGYYDRSLAQLRWRRPWMIGVAFDEQRCDSLPTAAWDQALDAVVTPTQTHIFRT